MKNWTDEICGEYWVLSIKSFLLFETGQMQSKFNAEFVLIDWNGF